MKIPKIKSMHVDALVRRDIEARWAEVNPVLATDELGYATDTDTFRVGDGESKWLDLPKYIKETVK